MKRRYALTGALIGLLALGAAGCSESLDDVEPQDGVTHVRLDNNQFKPRVIRIDEGTEVTWEWDDGSTKHDVAGDGFASEVQSEGTFKHTFEEAGTYDYRCNLHPDMTGRIIVEDS